MRGMSLALAVLALCSLACGDRVGGDEDATGETGEGDGDGDGDGDPVEGFLEDECAAMLACECPAPPYESVEDCVADLGVDLDPSDDELYEQLADAEELGLQWNPACADVKLDWFENGCDWAARRPCDSRYCPLFIGEAELGDPCEALGSVSTCGAGLGCQDEICVEICGLAGAGCSGPFGASCIEGYSCVGDIGANCEADSGLGGECGDSFGPFCATGLVCAGGTCETPPPVGDPCIDGSVCGAGDHCNDQGLCAAAKDVGAPCDGNWECATGQCEDNVCAALLDEGEVCVSPLECAPGLTCDFKPDPGTDTCAPIDPAVCPG